MTTIATKKAVKEALAIAFPGQTFRVFQTSPRPATFSIIYGCVRIAWKHGVSEEAVKAVIEGQFTMPADVNLRLDRKYTKPYLQQFMAEQCELTQRATTVLGTEDDAFLYCKDLPSLNRFLEGLLAAQTI